MTPHQDKKARIGLKIALALCAPIAALVFVAALGVSRLGGVSQELITALLTEVNQSNALILGGDRDFYQAMQAYLLLQDAADPKAAETQKKAFAENAKQTIDRVSKAVTVFLGGGNSAKTLKHGKSEMDIEALFAEFKKHYDLWAGAYDVSTNTMRNNGLFWASFDKARDAIDQMTEIIETYAEASVAHNTAYVSRTRNVLWGVAGRCWRCRP